MKTPPARKDEMCVPRAAALDSPAGRPKDADKHVAILDAARRLFFERGPAAVTIDAVAAAASVSRMTVYGHFGDKEALFAAVVERQALAVGRALAALSGRAAPSGPISRDTVRRDLVAFGVDLMAFLSQPDVRAFNRLMEGTAASHPELAKIWADNGPRAVFGALTAQMRSASSAGVIAAADPARAARHLLGLFKSIETSATAAGLAPPPTRAQIRRHVAECAELFLRAYAPVWSSCDEV